MICMCGMSGGSQKTPRPRAVARFLAPPFLDPPAPARVLIQMSLGRLRLTHAISSLLSCLRSPNSESCRLARAWLIDKWARDDDPKTYDRLILIWPFSAAPSFSSPPHQLEQLAGPSLGTALVNKAVSQNHQQAKQRLQFCTAAPEPVGVPTERDASKSEVMPATQPGVPHDFRPALQSAIIRDATAGVDVLSESKDQEKKEEKTAGETADGGSVARRA